jgi:hypothetical protein
MISESRDFEEITASIKRALEPRGDVKVVPHARVRDAVTKRMRDFDILIEAMVAGTPFRIGVECRRKKRPVDKPQVEGFVTKLRDCRVDKGVFVSSSGFADEAITAAEHHGIVCCHLTKVEVLPWFRLLSITGRVSINLRFHGDVQLVTDSPLEGIPSIVEFPDGSRPPMPFLDIGSYIVSLENVAAGHHRRRIVYEPSLRPMAVMTGDVRCQIVRIELDAEFDVIDLQPKIEHWLYARAGDAPSAGMTKVHLGDIDGVPLTLEVTATGGKSPSISPTPANDKAASTKT